MTWGELSNILDNPIAFHRIFATIGGGAMPGLFLSQAFYWTRVQERANPKADGWFYKTQREWTLETALTRYEQETARRELKRRGLLEESRRGVPAQLYYRLNRENLLKAIAEAVHLADFNNPAQSAAIKNVENQQTGMGETNKLACGKATIKNAGNQQTISTETTSESTQRGGHSIKNSKANGKNGISLEAAAAAAFAQLEPRDQKYVNEQVRMQGRALHEVMWELFNSDVARALRGK